MDVAKTLRDARTAAGLTQRQLAAKAGVPQSTVARIERGQMTPRVDTFDRLLRAVYMGVSAQRLPGYGVDRTLIRQLIALSPQQRLESAARDAHAIGELLGLAKRKGSARV